MHKSVCTALKEFFDGQKKKQSKQAVYICDLWSCRFLLSTVSTNTKHNHKIKVIVVHIMKKIKLFVFGLLICWQRFKSCLNACSFIPAWFSITLPGLSFLTLLDNWYLSINNGPSNAVQVIDLMILTMKSFQRNQGYMIFEGRALQKADPKDQFSFSFFPTMQK